MLPIKEEALANNAVEEDDGSLVIVCTRNWNMTFGSLSYGSEEKDYKVNNIFQNILIEANNKLQDKDSGGRGEVPMLHSMIYLFKDSLVLCICIRYYLLYIWVIIFFG